MKTVVSHSVEETEAFAADFVKSLKAPQVLCLYGDLGAGKTAFTRGLAQGLHSPDRVASPTFTIMHEYEGDVPIYHFDLYRIGSEEELFDIGFEEFLTKGIAVIEWPNGYEDLLPENYISVTLTYGGEENQRIIEVSP